MWASAFPSRERYGSALVSLELERPLDDLSVEPVMGEGRCPVSLYTACEESKASEVRFLYKPDQGALLGPPPSWRLKGRLEAGGPRGLALLARSTSNSHKMHLPLLFTWDKLSAPRLHTPVQVQVHRVLHFFA